jgi:hypothetical protein
LDGDGVEGVLIRLDGWDREGVMMDVLGNYVWKMGGLGLDGMNARGERFMRRLS